MASSYLTPPRKSQSRAKSLLSAPALNEQDQVVVLDVKAGDRTLFGKWSGTEVKLGGEELLFMKESDIMGIIEGSSGAKKKAPQSGCISDFRKD